MEVVRLVLNLFVTLWFFVGGVFALAYFYFVKNFHRWESLFAEMIDAQAARIEEPNEAARHRIHEHAILREMSHLSELFNFGFGMVPPEQKIAFVAQLIFVWPYFIWEMFLHSKK